jgi:hypothetical protein
LILGEVRFESGGRAARAPAEGVFFGGEAAEVGGALKGCRARPAATPSARESQTRFSLALVRVRGSVKNEI